MNTERNYSAQDNCANTSEQPVPFTTEAIAQIKAKSILVDTHLLLAQAETMELIQDFMTAYSTSDVVGSLNDLLFSWLIRTDISLGTPANRTQIHTTLQLIHFLTELYEKSMNWEYFLPSNQKEE